MLPGWLQEILLKVHRVVKQYKNINYVIFLDYFSNFLFWLLVAEQLQAQHNAIKMLANRVRLILEYIRVMERGEVPKSHEILREAKSLIHRLPVLNSEIFQEEYYTVSWNQYIFLELQDIFNNTIF